MSLSFQNQTAYNGLLVSDGNQPPRNSLSTGKVLLSSKTYHSRVRELANLDSK